MAYEHKEGKGSLFTNDFKQSENHPDYRGKAKWKGEIIEISAWKGESSGSEKISLSIQYPRQKQEGSESSQRQNNAPRNDDDIPF